MSSTETTHEAELLAFFRELVTAASAPRKGSPFFPLAPEPDLASYFRRREDDSTYVFDLDSQDVESQLMRLWQDAPELQALVAPLLQLAGRLSEREATTADVSPFVYAMF